MGLLRHIKHLLDFTSLQSTRSGFYRPTLCVFLVKKGDVMLKIDTIDLELFYLVFN